MYSESVSINLSVRAGLLMSSIPKLNQYQMPWGAISAAGCLMLLPAILFIVIFEKNIMGGLMMGSIKQ